MRPGGAATPIAAEPVVRLTLRDVTELDWRHLYAVLPCDRDDSLEFRPLWRRGPDRQVCRRLARFLNEPFHSRGRLNHKSSRRSASAGAVRVDHAPWKMNERSREP